MANANPYDLCVCGLYRYEHPVPCECSDFRLLKSYVPGAGYNKWKNKKTGSRIALKIKGG